MATRYYFPASSAASETTSPDAGWNYTSEVSRHNLSATKGSSAIGAGTTIGALAGTAGHKGVDRMYFSPALAAQSIAGTVSMMLMTREHGGTDNIDRPWMAVFVVTGNSKVATLLALSNPLGSATGEWVNNATHRTCTFAAAGVLTSYSCAAGDKILVEIGGGNSGSGTSPEFSCKWGENATDATLADNATTADRAGWVEFSATLTPATTPVDAGSMTTTATSSTTMAALFGLIMAAMTAVAQSVTSLLTLLGILSTSTTQAASSTSTTSSVEEQAAPIETGAMTSTGSSATTVTMLTGVLAGSITSAGTPSTTTASLVAVPTGAMLSQSTGGVTMESTIGPEAGGGNGGVGIGLGMGMGM